MRRNLVGLLTVAGATVLFSGSVLGHHGAGVYDTSKTITVTGEVSQFRFVNPHVLIYANVEQDGKTVEWSGELTSPNRLARDERGTVRWHKDILKPGDGIELTGNPARNGAPSLRLLGVVKIVDGKREVLYGEQS